MRETEIQITEIMKTVGSIEVPQGIEVITILDQEVGQELSNIIQGYCEEKEHIQENREL